MLGEFAVGKTSAISRYVKHTFSDSYLTTVGVKVDTAVVNLDGDETRLVIWDIAGSSHLSQVRLNYLRGASGFVMVADGTRRDSVSTALDLWRQANTALRIETPAVMLINKLDLADRWEISPELVGAINAQLPVFCVSAMTGQSIQEAFTAIAVASSEAEPR